MPVPLREHRRFCGLVCGGSFNEWLAEKTGLPREEAKRRFLIDVLAKHGSYPAEVENCFQSEFPNVHRFLEEARKQDYRDTIRSLQRLESWLVIEKVAPLLAGRAAIVTLHDAIFCGESDLPLVQDAFEEVFEKIGFRLSLKEEKWGPTHSAKVT